MQSFQYRLLQRGLVTNIQLYTWGIVQSNLCSFCKKEEETAVHIMCKCEESLYIWRQLSEYLLQEYNIPTTSLQPKSIILNQIVTDKRSIGNFLCLVTKQYIYKCRCLGKQLHFPPLRESIKAIENIEKYIAIKNGKEGKHRKKWRKMLTQ